MFSLRVQRRDRTDVCVRQCRTFLDAHDPARRNVLAIAPLAALRSQFNESALDANEHAIVTTPETGDRVDAAILQLFQVRLAVQAAEIGQTETVLLAKAAINDPGGGEW